MRSRRQARDPGWTLGMLKAYFQTLFINATEYHSQNFAGCFDSMLNASFHAGYFFFFSKKACLLEGMFSQSSGGVVFHDKEQRRCWKCIHEQLDKGFVILFPRALV